MSSRMDRYYENDKFVGSRTKRNEQLYHDINQSDLDRIHISSNAHVIGDNDINIDKIKELLEHQYREEPKKTNIFPTPDEKVEEDISYEKTKEYDINAILEKAKSTKDFDYNRDRLKKIHDTQYDILKDLNFPNKSYEESKVTSNKDDLVELINTITEKEMTRELNPLDILSDLKGSDNTVVFEGAAKESLNQSKPQKEETDIKKEIDKSFYTNSLSFTQSDFDDFNDLKEDVESNKLLIRVLLAIVAVALVVGILFLVNTVFHLNWF